jgi:TP901 family phage tail tape measure protein
MISVAINAAGAKKGATEFNAATKSMGRSATAAKAKVAGLGASTKKLKSTMGGMKAMFAGIGATILLTKTIKTMAGFEQTMATLSAVTGKFGDELSELESVARKMGSTTVFSAREAGEGLVFLARAGFTANDAIKALPGTLDLAQAGALDLGKAADIASNVLSQFGLAAEEMTRVGDVLVNTANSANTDVTQMAEALKMVGPVAGALGISLENTSAAIGALGDSGIQASMAGTNLRGVLAALLGPTGKAEAAMKRLGITAEELQPDELNDFSGVFKKLAGTSFSASDAVAMFGRRNAAAALILVDSIGKVESLTEANIKAEGAAKDAAKVMSDTLGGSFKTLVSAIEEAMIQVGEGGFGGAVRSTVDTLRSAIRIIYGFAEAEDKASKAANVLAVALRIVAFWIKTLIAKAVILFVIKLAKQLRTLTATVMALNVAMAANPIGLIVTGLALATAAFFTFSGGADSATRSAEQFAERQAALADRLKGFNAAVAAFERGTELKESSKQVSAIDSLIRLFEAKSEAFRVMAAESANAKIESADIIGMASAVEKITGRAPGGFGPDVSVTDYGSGPVVSRSSSMQIQKGISNLETYIRALQKYRDNLKDNKKQDAEDAQSKVDAVIATKNAMSALKKRIALMTREASLISKTAKQRAISNAIFANAASLEKLSAKDRLIKIMQLSQIAGLMEDEKQAAKNRKKTDAQAKADAAANVAAKESLDALIESQKMEVMLIGEDEAARVQRLAVERAEATIAGTSLTLTKDQITLIQALALSKHKAAIEAARIAEEALTAEGKLRIAKAESDAAEERRAQMQEDGLARAKETLRLMEQEIELSGMSNEAREREVARREFILALNDSEVEGVEALIAKYDELAGKLSSIDKKTKTMGESIEQTFERMGEKIGDAFADFFEDILVNVTSIEDAFENLARGIVRIMTEVLVMEPLRNSMRDLFSGLLSALSGALGGALGGGGDSGGETFDALVAAGDSITARDLALNNGKFASGGVFAHGDVFSGPTTFPMSGGRTGLLGEAGPEAILPLKRTADGKLGVEAGDGGSKTIIVNQKIYTRDAGSFDRSQKQVADGVRRAMSRIG